ncbi:hypothetical protein ES703_67792 [subsurface metagenome]
MDANWYEVTIEKLTDLWGGFLNFLPNLVGAIIVFVIGWFIAIGVGKLVTEVLKKLRFNRIFERGVWKDALAKAEFKIDAAGFIGAIIKWILVIVFLMAAVEILGLREFAGLLKQVLAYLPNVVVASFIFVVAVILADILEKVVRASVESIRVGYGQLVGMIVKWSIWIFAISIILVQLGVGVVLVQTLFTGLVAVIVISAGLAFGLGGKEIAADILKDLYRKLKG